MSLQTPTHRPATVTLRPVRASDAPAMQVFMLALSPASRRQRFHGAVNACSPALLRRLTTHDGQRHLGLVACVPAADGEVIVGEACCVRAAGAARAEFAIVVADALQGTGLAARLLQTLADAAAAAGVRTLDGDVLADNGRMQAFLQRLGFVPDDSAGPDEDGVQRWTRRLAPRADAQPLRDGPHGAAGLAARLARLARLWPAARPAPTWRPA